MRYLNSLPSGVTGFEKTQKTDGIEARRFKAACYSVTSRLGCTLDSFIAAGPGTNYHAATIVTNSQRASVLCNIVFPFLAIVPAGQFGFQRLTFLPPGAIGSAFEEFSDFEVIDPVCLSTDLRQEHIAALTPAERAQLSFWQRRHLADRIGDVIFNAWD